MRATPLRLVIFLGVLGTVTALLHGYAWLRLVRDPSWPPMVETALTVLAAALTIALPASMIAGRTLPARAASIVGWSAFLWLGVLFYLDVTLLVLDGARAGLSSVAYASFGSAGLDGTGGARAFAAATALVATGLVGLGLVRGLSDPIVRRVRVPIEGLPTGLEGLRIVQITDVHVGPTIRRPFVERLVKKIASLDPEIVAITGDLVDGSLAALRSEVAPLAGLSAPLGVYFVTGNHEYFSGADAWSEHVASLGITTLRNQHVTVERGGARLTIAGVEDAHAPRMGGKTDLAAALRDRDPDAKVLLLAHQPRAIESASKAGVALQISGHTHGGQMQPFGALVRIEQPFLRGLHRVKDTMLYVSEGTGYWGPPLRVGTRAEISLLELTRA